jgi:hypothetical protein
MNGAFMRGEQQKEAMSKVQKIRTALRSAASNWLETLWETEMFVFH